MYEFNPKTREAYLLLHKGIQAFARAEQQGIRVDLDYCEQKKQEITSRIETIETELKQTKFYQHWRHAFGGKTPNIGSNDQLGKFLYDIKKIEPAFTTESGKGSTDEEALTQLNIPELNMILQVRKLKKIRDTYLDAFLREQVNGYIHPFYNLHNVVTFRGSSDSPNFQNIPKRDKEAMQLTRKALFPRPGHQLAEMDFSGIEVRIAATYHKDPIMLTYIKDPKSDMHLDMAEQLYILNKPDKSIPEIKHLRQAAKNGFVFPQFYGDYYKNCAISLACSWGKLPEGKWSKKQGVPLPGGITLGEHLISKGIKSLDNYIEHVKQVENDFWGTRFKVYNRWKEKWWKQYQRNGYIDLHTGFRCSGIMRKNEVINTPVQGAAFHCLLWCFIRLDEIILKEKLQTKLIGQIHDAIVFDIYPPEKPYIMELIKRVTGQDLVNEWKWINVPMDVEVEMGDIDKSWAELKPIHI